ncbi:MAG: YcjF family protein [Chthoniobacterales bacterium]
MNNSVFLHIVERLEAFLGKLPESMQKPILHELTPLKELFLQQRPPRFVLTGSHPIPLLDFAARIFAPEGGAGEPSRDTLTGLFRWQNVTIGHQGAVEMLDARGADEAALGLIREELKTRPADLFFFLAAERAAKVATRREIERLESLVSWNSEAGTHAKLIELRASAEEGSEASALQEAAVSGSPSIRTSLVGSFPLDGALRRTLASELPNEARVEMVRMSGDRAAQKEIAEMLVKSTSAICTAIGAQPIPLADLPILTTLQLVMVSGVMYVSGRERSMRAATEFIGALGANVGLGMILREGTRAALKFFPGWGNVVCGMVAGAGTYAIGRAAKVYFIEGASLKDARRTFLKTKKERVKVADRRARKEKVLRDA